ncbi:hypothetical protein LWI28_028625 [Acer negundo]|uniref:Uncharacterized protein n=1 Tax=Acer negundo TaxID=4023 RepID=A0AAD5IGP6_ACENE|nr:hypothetical protein LWI28_028625 [Acer negundo]
MELGYETVRVVEVVNIISLPEEWMVVHEVHEDGSQGKFPTARGGGGSRSPAAMFDCGLNWDSVVVARYVEPQLC